MRLIGESGGVDLALLPIGDNFTMGPEDAVLAAQFVKAKRVIPIHYNTFPVIEQDAAAFAERLRSGAEIDCIVMTPGQEFVLE
jgi:L-ascorbate metabolism protein UlaG (beta-lactamase superfamily)